MRNALATYTIFVENKDNTCLNPSTTYIRNEYLCTEYEKMGLTSNTGLLASVPHKAIPTKQKVGIVGKSLLT